MLITRRHAGLAAAALPLLPGVALAQATPTAPQNPGFYRFKLGGFTVTTVYDGFNRRNVEGLVLNAPLEEVRGVLAQSFLPAVDYRGPYTVTFVDTGRLLIAFDAGTGGQMAATAGLMTANMAAAGIDPARVGLVIVTHCHQDHIHGLTTADGRAVFPNAEIAINEAEYAWWTDASNESRSPQGQRVNFANVARRFAPYQGRIRRFAAETEVTPGVRAIAAYGHSPGHSVFQVADGDAQLMVLADLTHRPELFARRPGYISTFDFDGAAGGVSRMRVLDRVAADRMRVTGYHFPFPATGYIAKEGDGFRYVASDWSSPGI
ncbi:MBL fold metallo-hydrolase [Humitalea sp. 24SJ18S-53]|uniref:MBL fold metallo-hydrolase n=1 Tax=Humitalea sp. 24SJ18S-53 TaxID=3422307 RepID=UPI003D678C50